MPVTGSCYLTNMESLAWATVKDNADKYPNIFAPFLCICNLFPMCICICPLARSSQHGRWVYLVELVPPPLTRSLTPAPMVVAATSGLRRSLVESIERQAGCKPLIDLQPPTNPTHASKKVILCSECLRPRRSLPAFPDPWSLPP